MAQQTIKLRLNIPAHRLLDYYRGVADTVVAHADDGRIIHLPAAILRSVVTRDGIDGEFLLRIDEKGKFISLQPLDERA